ncbi:hypothetical protein [Fimbriiglobus ruber]|uniref:Uncharacterized protein n=1 Tax=Fimbriiglobus ruber TaxID=1908690 RepID=A0A225DVU4_9BACT|nr:hypothetical protein [Fimbriiglobus ruber]OWK45492.1 hypothetical protein FRUB_01823 [Fimbriiglobus ruber]
MNVREHFTGLAAGAGLGALAALLVASGTLFYLSQPRLVGAASNDRFQDYVMATGAVSLSPRIQADGVWVLDYRAGKLLGTVIDKAQGKIVGWAEVDLVGEFQVEPRQDVHFMMVTGFITNGQSALYVAEMTTGKFGVYTMGGGPNGSSVVIRRHDLTSFRKAPEPANAAPAAPPVPPLKAAGG